MWMDGVEEGREEGEESELFENIIRQECQLVVVEGMKGVEWIEERRKARE